MNLDPRLTPDRQFVTLSLPGTTMTIPLARWPLEAEALGLGQWQDDTFTPVVPAEPAPEFPALSRKRLLLALLAMGRSEDQVLAVIATVPDPQMRAVMRIEFQNTVEYHRDHPFIAQLGGALGLTPAQIDAAWLAAAGAA